MVACKFSRLSDLVKLGTVQTHMEKLLWNYWMDGCQSNGTPVGMCSVPLNI